MSQFQLKIQDYIYLGTREDDGWTGIRWGQWTHCNSGPVITINNDHPVHLLIEFLMWELFYPTTVASVVI